MNVDYINPFVESINNILVTMASMSCEYGRPYLKPDHAPLGVVTGLIPMSGDTVSGSLAISFTSPVILLIGSRMLGEEIKKVDDTCHDLTGELTNMLSGGARRILWEKGYQFEMAQPVVLRDTPEVKHLTDAPVIVIPFETQVGQFYIEVALGSRLRRASLIESETVKFSKH